MSYDMLLIPAWNPPSPLPNSQEDKDMGSGGMEMAMNVAKGKKTMEKGRENLPREHIAREIGGTQVKVPRVEIPTSTKIGKERGPKAWTALEREGGIPYLNFIMKLCD
jgi:hypothetical protein